MVGREEVLMEGEEGREGKGDVLRRFAEGSLLEEPEPEPEPEVALEALRFALGPWKVEVCDCVGEAGLLRLPLPPPVVAEEVGPEGCTTLLASAPASGELCRGRWLPLSIPRDGLGEREP